MAKHELIAALNERLAASPIALPAAGAWDGLTAAKDEFRRVTFTASYPALPDATEVITRGDSPEGEAR